MARIEVSHPIEIVADIAFWIDRDEWEKMTHEEKCAKIDESIDAAYLHLSNDVIRVLPNLSIAATVTGPELGIDDLSKVAVYDSGEA